MERFLAPLLFCLVFCAGAEEIAPPESETAPAPEIVDVRPPLETAPRTTLYASLAEALAANDLYGAMEWTTPAPEEAELAANPLLDVAPAGMPTLAANLVRTGWPVDGKSLLGENALHLAAAANQAYTVVTLAHLGADIAAWSEEGYQPLHVASRSGKLEAIAALMSIGADYHWNTGREPIMDAPTVALVNRQYDATALFRRHGMQYGIFRQVAYGDLAGVQETLAATPTEIGAEDGMRNTPLLAAVGAGHAEMVRLLLENNAAPEARNVEGKDALSVAVNSNRGDMVRLLAEAGADLTTQRATFDEESLVEEAVLNRNLAMMKVLQEVGAPLDQKNHLGYSPAHRAVEKGHREELALLLDAGARLDSRNRQGDSMLHTAARMRNLDLAVMLLERGAEWQAWNLRRETPMHAACASGAAAMVDLFLSEGAMMTLRDIDGRTPMMLAAEAGHTDILRRLAADDPNVQDLAGRTALHIAVARGFVDAATALLDAGASPNVLDAEHRPPLAYAFMDERFEMVTLLAERGADVTYRFPNGQSLLFGCLHENVPTMAGWFIEQGVPAADRDETGWTPLHQAAMVGTEPTVELLLSQGADVEATDAEGRTPLHIACRRGHILVVKALSLNRANAEVRDARGWLPMHYAAAHGHWGPIQYFLLRGADINALTPDGKNCMHLSSETFMYRTTALLFSKGGDLLQRDNAGNTPLSAIRAVHEIRDIGESRTPNEGAHEMNVQGTLNYLRMAYAELMNILLDDPETERLSLLLELHPEYANLTFEGWTPLQRAVRLGNTAAVAVLLAHGADAQALDERGLGRTALHFAAEANATEAASAIAASAPGLATMPDASGQTPVALAAARGFSGLAEQLIALAPMDGDDLGG